MNYSQALQLVSNELKNVSFTHQQDAIVLITSILGISREMFYAAEKSTSLSSTQEKDLLHMLQQLKQGKPLAQVIGHIEFLGQLIKVTPDVLIPRPETEQLVEMLLKDLQKWNKKSLSILEIGMGSGCIITALASKLGKLKDTEVHLVGIEPSLAAFNVACENISQITDAIVPSKEKFRQFDKRNLHIICINLAIRDFKLPGFVPDIVISNPPYITSAEYEKLDSSVRDHEPKLALWGGDDGLDIYREILRYSTSLPGQPELYLEISSEIERGITRLLQENDYTRNILKDLFGRVRFAICKHI